MLVVVLGTGTGIGKTAFSCALLRLARAEGVEARGLKPVQTGAEVPSDADLLGRAAGTRVPPLYEYDPPISPHLAARAAGDRVEVPRIVSWVRAEAERFTLVETAGGAFSPLSEDECNWDLALALNPDRVFLVSSASLGVFHATRAALLAIASSGRRLSLEVVVSATDSEDAGSAAAREVLALNRGLLRSEPLVLGPGGTLSASSVARLRELWNPPR